MIFSVVDHHDTHGLQLCRQNISHCHHIVCGIRCAIGIGFHRPYTDDDLAGVDHRTNGAAYNHAHGAGDAAYGAAKAAGVQLYSS